MIWLDLDPPYGVVWVDRPSPLTVDHLDVVRGLNSWQCQLTWGSRSPQQSFLKAKIDINVPTDCTRGGLIEHHLLDVGTSCVEHSLLRGVSTGTVLLTRNTSFRVVQSLIHTARCFNALFKTNRFYVIRPSLVLEVHWFGVPSSYGLRLRQRRSDRRPMENKNMQKM